MNTAVVHHLHLWIPKVSWTLPSSTSLHKKWPLHLHNHRFSVSKSETIQVSLEQHWRSWLQRKQAQLTQCWVPLIALGYFRGNSNSSGRGIGVGGSILLLSIRVSFTTSWGPNGTVSAFTTRRNRCTTRIFWLLTIASLALSKRFLVTNKIPQLSKNKKQQLLLLTERPKTLLL